MIRAEDSRTQTSDEDVKKKRDKAAKPTPPVVAMSPEAAAIIHGHLPELWVKEALFVGPDYERLDAVMKQSEAEMEQPKDNS